MTEPLAKAGTAGKLPGNVLIWILIVSELLVFGLALLGFLVARLLEPQQYAQGGAVLHSVAGAINMAVLLTSGLLAALALQAVRLGATHRTRLLLLSAALLGCVFVAVKAVEYADLARLGFSIDSNVFFTLYFLVTGFHAAHVIFGIAVLLLLAAFPDEGNVEAGTAFWHMVDLVWVIVFPVVYLMP